MPIHTLTHTHTHSHTQAEAQVYRERGTSAANAAAATAAAKYKGVSKREEKTGKALAQLPGASLDDCFGKFSLSSSLPSFLGLRMRDFE